MRLWLAACVLIALTGAGKPEEKTEIDEDFIPDYELYPFPMDDDRLRNNKQTLTTPKNIQKTTQKPTSNSQKPTQSSQKPPRKSTQSAKKPTTIAQNVDTKPVLKITVQPIQSVTKPPINIRNSTEKPIQSAQKPNQSVQLSSQTIEISVQTDPNLNQKPTQTAPKPPTAQKPAQTASKPSIAQKPTQTASKPSTAQKPSQTVQKPTQVAQTVQKPTQVVQKPVQAAVKPTAKPTAKPTQKQKPSTTPAPSSPCVCKHGQCTCCSGPILDLFQQKACLNVVYTPEDFSFDLTMLLNNKVMYKNKVSGKNPPPACIRIPRLTSLKLCAKFSNIYFAGRNLHMCMGMEGLWDYYELFSFSFDCVRMGANGIAVVKPEDGGIIPGVIGGVDAVIDSGDDIEDYDENVVRANS